MVRAQLNGFYPPEFESTARQRYALGAPSPGIDRRPRDIDIADARALQAAEPGSEGDFFARHGFVLLPHATAVRDWDTDVARVYLPEIERIVRERLLPGRSVQVQQSPSLLRRGRDTPVPFYAEGVHSDGGLDAEDYAHNIAAFSTEQAGRWWRTCYEQEDVAGLIWIDFWRTTNMAGPLQHMPLALCDPSSLDPFDLVRTGITGIAPEGRESHHLSLRYNPGQHWYHYPLMTGDELLAFKLAEFWKTPSPPGNCFHSAFRPSDMPADAELRQSCEHRVGVLVLRE